MPETPRIIGLDIGGTKTAAIRGDMDGNLYERIEFATQPERGFDATFDKICEAVNEILSQSGDAVEFVISVSIGGPLDLEHGIILSPPNLPGWDDVPLRAMLEDRFGVQVYIEHDGNAGALAEWRFGAARGTQTIIFLTMGTGFGGGLIIDGRLHRGVSSTAGEVGHIRLSENGPTAFGKTGSWEGLCGGAGIAARAAMRHPDRWGPGSIDVKELAQLAHTGDSDVLKLFRDVGHDLGRGLAILIDIINPEVVVIGSLAVRLGDLVLREAREVVKKEALPAAVKLCRILPAELGEKAGDMAALCAAGEALRRLRV